jgi:Icc-related predicted phosphoesterase
VKILAVSDVVVDRLYSPEVRVTFPALDLILGCGDLPYEYLEFLVSSFDVPLLYVPGNHDPLFDASNPASRADGCDNIDLRVVQAKGLTLAGLGGGIRYHPDRPNQYSQAEMHLRATSLAPALLWNRFRPGGVLDIVVAHSPPRGIHDDDDLAHTGFDAFVNFIKFFKPRYFLHGHTMPPKSNLDPSSSRLGATLIININPYRLIEVESHG